jgi:hypothetical protein
VGNYHPGRVYIIIIIEVEWVLSSLGVLKTDLESDPFDNEEYSITKLDKKKPKRDDESDEEDRKDREYSWKIYRK